MAVRNPQQTTTAIPASRGRKLCVQAALLVCLLLAARPAAAQADKWTGTWQMQYKPWPHIPAVVMELQVGAPRQGMLYPAQLKLQYPPFSGTYELLLARKNENQLGIGRGKWPVSETPFKLGPWLLYLNGTFNYSKVKGVPVMSMERMWISSFGLFMKGLYDDDEIYVNTKVRLRDFLYRDSIALSRKNGAPWESPRIQKMLYPGKGDVYLGVYDSIPVRDSLAQLSILDDDLVDRDTITLLHNNRTLLNKSLISDSALTMPLPLDTGANLLVFFADNYGKLPPNTGNFMIRADSVDYGFNFATRGNAYATFLVAQLYRVQGNAPLPQNRQQQDPRTEQRTTTLISEISSSAPLVELELWDDAVEDGDSISIRLNNQPVVSGFPVKKKKQQVSIALRRGENRLLLLADNLGSIPPNTAVMRVQAGTEARYLKIKTDLQQNNLVLIRYEPETRRNSRP